MTIPSRAKVLDEVKELITGDRNETHGEPIINLNCEARMVDAYFDARHSKSNNSDHVTYDALDIAVTSILKKIARIAAGNRLEPDHFADIIGYAAIGVGFIKDKDVE